MNGQLAVIPGYGYTATLTDKSAISSLLSCIDGYGISSFTLLYFRKRRRQSRFGPKMCRWGWAWQVEFASVRYPL